MISWRLALISTAGGLWLASACGGKSAQHDGAGQAGAPAAGVGARGGANASGGKQSSLAGVTNDSESGEGGAAPHAGGGRGGRGGRTSISGAAGAGGATGGGVLGSGGDGAAGAAAGDGGALAAGGDGASGEPGGEGASGGTLECGDCSLPDEMCFVGVCDRELGRCDRVPVVACQSGDGCCPSGCAQDDDTDCTTFRVVLEPSFSGNRSEDGVLGATTFAGRLDEQGFYAFLGFDLSGIAGTLASAELDLYYEGYLSSYPLEHFVVQTAQVPIDALLDTAIRTDVFDALQSGGYCFDTAMTSEHVGLLVPFGLNEDTLAELNANFGSSVAFGIIADGTSGNSADVEGIRFSDGVTPPLERLILIVEPP